MLFCPLRSVWIKVVSSVPVRLAALPYKTCMVSSLRRSAETQNLPPPPGSRDRLSSLGCESGPHYLTSSFCPSSWWGVTMWLLDSVRTMWPAIMDLRISIHWINTHPGKLPADITLPQEFFFFFFKRLVFGDPHNFFWVPQGCLFSWYINSFRALSWHICGYSATSAIWRFTGYSVLFVSAGKKDQATETGSGTAVRTEHCTAQCGVVRTPLTRAACRLFTSAILFRILNKIEMREFWYFLNLTYPTQVLQSAH